jgi:hypothetical protein
MFKRIRLDVKGIANCNSSLHSAFVLEIEKLCAVFVFEEESL